MELKTHLPPNTLKSKFVPPLRAIAMAVAQKHGIEFHHLRVKRRLAPLILARGEFVYRALTETTESLVVIGRYLNRHHGTVGYIMRRYCRQYGLPIPRGLKIYERRFRDIHRIKYLRPVGHLDRAERRIFYQQLAETNHPRNPQPVGMTAGAVDMSALPVGA